MKYANESRSRARVAGFGAALAVLSLGAAANAQPSTAPNPGEVVVTGKLEETLPSELSQFGNRLNVITPQQLQAGGFVDVSSALAREVPGLYLAPRSGPFDYFDASLQGSRSSEVLYLVDGVRISNRLYNTTPPLDTVPANMIDRIEVLEGGQGLFYGTQAIAGVINIVTRPFTSDLRGQAALGGDTNHSWTASAWASGAINGHQLVGYASHDQSTGFQPFPDADYQPSGTDRHRGYRLDTFGLKYAYDLTDALRFSASYQHTEGFVDFARPAGVAMAINERNEEIATAKIDWTASDKLQLFLKGYWHDWESHFSETDNDAVLGPVLVDDHEFWGFHDYGVNAVAKYVPRMGLETYVGYDLQTYGGRDDVLLIADKNEHTHAVFAQVRITPDMIARTHLAAGVRYNSPSDGESATVWNVSGQFDLTDDLFIKASGGTSFRLPDAESLYAIDPINNGEVGNPNLKPERSISVNGSIGGRVPLTNGAVNWEVIGFLRDTKDLIDLSGATSDPNVSTFINLPDKVKVRGVEAVVDAAISPEVSFKASYTHSHTRMAGSTAHLAGIPEDQAQALLDYHPAEFPVGGSIVANWVGSVFDNVPSGIGAVDHGHYVVVDLNAYVQFGANRRHRISARLENAFDEDYATAVRRTFDDATGSPYAFHYRGVPRTFHLKYDYSF